MAIYKSPFFHIDIEEQDYPDADCKYLQAYLALAFSASCNAHDEYLLL